MTQQYSATKYYYSWHTNNITSPDTGIFNNPEQKISKSITIASLLRASGVPITSQQIIAISNINNYNKFLLGQILPTTSYNLSNQKISNICQALTTESLDNAIEHTLIFDYENVTNKNKSVIITIKPI